MTVTAMHQMADSGTALRLELQVRRLLAPALAGIDATPAAPSWRRAAASLEHVGVGPDAEPQRTGAGATRRASAASAATPLPVSVCRNATSATRSSALKPSGAMSALFSGLSMPPRS